MRSKNAAVVKAAIGVAGLWFGWETASVQAVTTFSYPSSFQIKDKSATASWNLTLDDYAIAPKSRLGAGDAKTALQVARINFIRQEPVPALAAARAFIPDLNGNLYIFNRTTKQFGTGTDPTNNTDTPTNYNTPYINFKTTFAAFDNDPGFAAGLVTVQFDPDYQNNHLFYSVHTENVSGVRQAVLSKWFDPNINNTTLDGGSTHTEMMRVPYSSNIHPMGDLIFNPTATGAGSTDWRNMYIASGDGGAGEASGTLRNKPQRLDDFRGKILRITPTATSSGTYTVPSDNPFTNATLYPGAAPEVYADGLRNPHRLSWDVDPSNSNINTNNVLIVDNIGLNNYEEINIVRKGANYGYSKVEGTQNLSSTTNQVTTGSPTISLPVLTTADTQNPVPGVQTVSLTFPVAQYSHRDGDAISSGFVYRGQNVPQLQGKYVFGDIPNGRLFYCDLADLKAVNDGQATQTLEGNPTNASLNKIHELTVFYSSPFDSDGLKERRVFDIVQQAYDRRNDDFDSGTGEGEELGTAFYGNPTSPPDRLPGAADSTDTNDPYGVAYRLPGQTTGGRSDIRWALIDDELYLISKSDGIIRALTITKAGDVDRNGLVDSVDLGVLALHWNTAGFWKDGDLSHDGFVNVNDLSILAANWQGSGDSFSEAISSLGLPQVTVPEPTALSLISVGGMFLLRRRRET